MFDNGTSCYKSDERLIESEHTYWWTGPANHDATQAINFLTYLEGRRNAVEDTSICNISSGNIATIIGIYNSFDAENLATYVDCSTIYTWTDGTKTANKLWTVKEVMEQLSELSGVALGGGSSLATVGNPNSNQSSDTVVAVVVIVAFISISALAMLIVIKKRKHN